ncbi:HdeA/HdeB family chaperone [Reyranella sp.]|uniref:HdeA/HdeB family chaperone n=1 Tax=Reyranella sp. TaxID=1929291 RepID=UPI003D1170B0
MTARILAVAATLLAASASAQAQVPPLNFEQAAYVTCRDAHAMQPQARQALAVFLADHAARYRGVAIPENEQGAQLAHLVRGGCTLAPDAYLFTVIDRALVAELAKLPKRQ